MMSSGAWLGAPGRPGAPVAASGAEQQRRLIAWNPHLSDLYAVVSTGISLYGVGIAPAAVGIASTRSMRSEISLITPPLLPTYGARHAEHLQTATPRLLSSLPAQQPDQAVTCIEWELRDKFPTRLAVGTANGNTLLLELDRELDSNYVPAVFKPRYGRRCNCVAFNPHQPTQMAVGLEKVRNDDCAVIWDVAYSHAGSKVVQPGAFHIGRGLIDASRTVNFHQVPMYKFSHSESIGATAWLAAYPCCLAVAAGRKWVRVYDTRSLRDPVISLGTHLRSLKGVIQQPFRDNQVTSFSDDGIIKIWDLRKMDGQHLALATLSVGSSIHQIAWSPTRSNILACITGTDSEVKMFDLSSPIYPRMPEQSTISKPAPAQQPEPTETHPEWITHPHGHAKYFRTAVECISWHPTTPNLMVVLTCTGNVEHVSFHDRVPINWSSSFELASGLDRDMIIQPADKYSDNIGQVMRRRIDLEYSLRVETNTRVLRELQQTELLRLWEWIGYASAFWPQLRLDTTEAIPRRSATPAPPLRIEGTITLLFGNNREASSQPLTGIVSESQRPLLDSFVVYHNKERAQAIRLLGWFALDTEYTHLNAWLQQLESSGELEKAAALAIFHLDLERAIQSLCCSKDTKLHLVALALAGYQQNVGDAGLWSETCRHLQFDHPYLRAAFTFLRGGQDWQSKVLAVDGVGLQDLVAFACRFLPDGQLEAFVMQMHSESIATGRIDGLVLAGIGPKSIALLQSYLDRTADIQTVALIACYALSALDETKHRECAIQWIEEYRNLADMWKRWHYRARFDIERRALTKDMSTMTPQISARCNYCNVSLALSKLSSGMRATQGTAMMGVARGSAGIGAGSRSRINGCPNCKKPLPRCSVCLMPLDCAAPPSIRQRRRVVDGNVQPAGPFSRDSPNVFDRWFSWCQSCHHAAHAGHINEWFKTHDECPVTGCSCKCSARDLIR